MALGIIAGALAGGGEAVRDAAMLELNKRKQAALAKLDNDLAMQRQDDSQQFTAGENTKTRDFTTDERNASQDFTSTENARNRQTTISQNAADRALTLDQGNQLVPNADGTGYMLYNPYTNTTQNAPAGIDPQSLAGGEMTERDQAQLDVWSTQAEGLRERISNGLATPDDKIRLGEIEADMQQLLGGGGGANLIDTLEQTLDGVDPAGGNNPIATNISGQPSATGLLNSARQEDKRRAAKQETAARVDNLTGQADNLIEAMTPKGRDQGGVLGVSSAALMPGASRTDPQFAVEAQAVANELIKIHDNPGTSDFQRNQIIDALYRLQDLGVTTD